MVSLPNDVTLIGFQEFIKTVYSLTNDRYYGFSDMTNNIQRFTMRSLKGIRKNDFEKTKLNLLIACVETNYSICRLVFGCMK